MTGERERDLPPIRMSAEIGALAAALAAAQAEFPAVAKDNFAKVETRDGKDRSYHYADLASCLAAVRGPLSRHKLAVMQPTCPDGRDVMLTTILAHESGQWIASDLPMVADWLRPQAMGSVITYARRYALCALLQIATDDDDGQAAEAHAGARRPERRADRPGPRPARPSYREWLDSFTEARNAEWAEKHPGVKGALMPKFRLNRHLLNFLYIHGTDDESTNLKLGAEAWRSNAAAMEAEALRHCRDVWLERAGREKAKGRAPGSDDELPSADEEAVLDRLHPPAAK